MRLQEAVPSIPCSPHIPPSSETMYPYVLFAWQTMCEWLMRNGQIEHDLDIEKLKDKLPAIKELMFADADRT